MKLRWKAYGTDRIRLSVDGKERVDVLYSGIRPHHWRIFFDHVRKGSFPDRQYAKDYVELHVADWVLQAETEKNARLASLAATRALIEAQMAELEKDFLRANLEGASICAGGVLLSPDGLAALIRRLEYLNDPGLAAERVESGEDEDAEADLAQEAGGVPDGQTAL